MKQILLTASIALSLISCGSTPATKTSTADSTKNTVEVIYFHGKQRCVTCNEIERHSKFIVDSLASDTIVMRIVDISTPDGEAIADAYQVTWSSLFVEYDGTAENLTDMAFSYAKGQPELFKTKLVESIKNIAQ